MFPLDLPLPTAALPGTAAPAEGQPHSASVLAFDALLASLVPTPADGAPVPEAQTGDDLPDTSAEPGNPLPATLVAPLLPSLQQPLPDSPLPAPVAAPVRVTEPIPPHQSPSASQLEPPLAGTDPEEPLPTPVLAQHAVASEIAAQPAESAPQHFRAPEAVLPVLPQREPVSLSAPAPAPSASAAPQSVQLEALVEVLAQAREAGRGARGELAVRHAEFGQIAIRLEQDSGETRAQLVARDPGFAPTVIAALAERGSSGFTDQHQNQRGSDQSWSQQPSAHSDPRQSDRRSPAQADREQPLRQPADSGLEDDNRPAPPRDSQARFA